MNIALLERVTKRKINKSNRLPAKEKHFYSSKNSIAATPAVKSEFNRDMQPIAVTNSNYFMNVDREMGMIVEPMQGCCELLEW